MAKLLLTVTALVSLAVLLSGTSALSTAGPLMRPDWSPLHGGAGHDLHGVWGSSDNDVFAVGESGTILHYDGKRWTTIMKSGTKDPLDSYKDSLYGVWGSSRNDVFAVGPRLLDDNEPYVLHYDGSSWSTMSSPAGGLYGVWGSCDNDVFAVGALSRVLHYDGNAWTIISGGTTNDLYAIWGSSHNDVFAVGGGSRVVTFGSSVSCSTILHYDGSTWTAMSSGTTNPLKSVWGTSDNNVFAVGMCGTILHYDGNEWSTVTSGIAPDLHAVWGSSDNNIFAVGDSGTILHFDGNTWSRMSVRSTRTGFNSTNMDPLYGIWGSSENDVFAVGSETILHHPGYFTTISKGVNWGLVGRAIAVVALVGTVFTVLWLIDRRGRRKTVEEK